MMAISNAQKQDIAEVLRSSLRYKLNNYHPEPNSMPFHTRLLGSDRLALFSFIHSLNTNFGTTIFEPVAVALAKSRFRRVESQFVVGNCISEKAQREIQRIMDNLTTADEEPDKTKELERIRAVCRSEPLVKVKLTRVDLLLESSANELYLFDLKTAKPNKGGFNEFKRTLLEWTAVALYENPNADINAAIAIPYNPYEPKPYARWTMRGMLDLKSQLLVADELWDFLGGKGTYEELLDIFESVGIELRTEIDDFFIRFK